MNETARKRKGRGGGKESEEGQVRVSDVKKKKGEKKK